MWSFTPGRFICFLWSGSLFNEFSNHHGQSLAHRPVRGDGFCHFALWIQVLSNLHQIALKGAHGGKRKKAAREFVITHGDSVFAFRVCGYSWSLLGRVHAIEVFSVSLLLFVLSSTNSFFSSRPLGEPLLSGGTGESLKVWRDSLKETRTISSVIYQGDEIHAKVFIEDGVVVDVTESIVGRTSLHELFSHWKTKLMGVSLEKLPVPKGAALEELLLKEWVLKLKGEWGDEPSDHDLCHCRRVSQKKVEQSLFLGAHDLFSMQWLSSANTGCGTCLPDIEKIFKRYLG